MSPRISPSGDRRQPWHVLSVQDACLRLDADIGAGLSAPEAQARLDRFGANRLPEPPPRPLWKMVVSQFTSLLVLVLLVAGALAGFVGDTTDMLVIFGVILFNGALGFYQEFRAEKALDALKAMLPALCRVRRDGTKQEVPAAQLVPGDVVLLEAGDRIPADGRLAVAHQLEIDESSLTGESLAVAKQLDALSDHDLPLAERTNLAHMNSVVTRGRGEMVVAATGAATEMGRIAGMLQAAGDETTPLQQRLDQLGRRLALLAGLVVALYLALGLMRGEPVAQLVLTAIALAVAAIPEGLPAVVTVTLAIGMVRMARKGAIVKRLAAVETLGSTTVICSDKTGTLTMNQMTAVAGWAAGRRFVVDGEGYGREGAVRPADDGGPLPDLAPHLAAARLCTESMLADDGQGGRMVVGDATEGALLVLADKAHALQDWPRLAEVPFDSARKFMVSVHRLPDGGLRLLVKGAPDVVLGLCRAVRLEGGEHVLDRERADQVARENEAMAAKALRVLALAEAEVDETALADPLAAARDLTLTALIGLLDPPRPGARAAVAACRTAGIAVKMITGDHRVTAAAIGRALGLDGEVVTGAELDRMDDAELAGRIDDIAVFARVAPEHKVRIVEALRARGHVAAMTGDGVNDAASLKAAHIGVAMGRTGSDVTREAATMVLTDDDFSTVVGAVREGRTITDNIVKFVRFQLSTNIGALLTVLAAPIIGLASPFHPIQILWVNIIMDGPPALALSFDPARPGLMEEPPKAQGEAILSVRRLLKLALYGTTMAVGTLAVFAWGLSTGDETQARTLAFTTFVLFQFFNVFNARVGHESALGPQMFANAKLWVALAGVIALQAAAVHWGPAQAIFHTSDLSALQWGVAVAVASMVLVLDEARKAIGRFIPTGQ
ncbi:Calcium-transporting ATPase [Magnetospirillum sp. LM-5]|uniref:cation-translocating P-type ATPase n=1 Tax=Magnetospirillum sp. LM-5 TaxID=2681466 RepID=UPI00137D1460|nr:cation-transporting P-type ATPase [Magnetospirillum sp. LM-5]CAA7625451.1 Calcium-transporting ATPase [Magnetospirillum sp. LM-5]